MKETEIPAVPDCAEEEVHVDVAAATLLIVQYATNHPCCYDATLLGAAIMAEGNEPTMTATDLSGNRVDYVAVAEGRYDDLCILFPTAMHISSKVYEELVALGNLQLH